ncbi:MAG: GNAT family N-acetyltransferase [Candidatus Heimdallarchaeota archaeon]|nr:GNAT family N-acetyltransferase [Candidatus Heimdallarchaeota archaeon]MDH5646827.1 GNAT family N-acetyltransferase [Candidatus Heimdallarchaeota archaeon]
MNKILLDISNKFETPNIILKPYQNGDGGKYYNLLMENKEHLQRTVEEIKELKSIEDAEVFIRKRMIDWIARDRFVLSIYHKTQMIMIGQIWIEPINWEIRIFEIGYFISKKFQGKGFVKDAINLSCNFIFNELKAKKIEIHTDLINERSWKLAEKCGFKREAEIRMRTKLPDGTLDNRLYYGLIRDEFNS